MKSILSSRNQFSGNKTAVSHLILLAGTLLVGFSMGRWLAPLAAWIGPVLFLRYARDHKVGRGFLLVFVAYIVAFLIGFGVMWEASWGIVMMATLAVTYGLLWSLPILADRLLSPNLRGFSATLVFPLAATTFEFLNIHSNPVGIWGATGFTQFGILPLMQLASVTGMIGITFMMGWFASVVNWSWENRDSGGEIVRGVGVFATVLALVFISGYVRLNLAPLNETSGTVRVAGITAEPAREMGQRFDELPDPDLNSPAARQMIEAHWERYFSETVREAQAGATVVLWPETAGGGTASTEDAHVTRAQEVARENGIYLAIPLWTMPDDPNSEELLVNKLLVIDPTGSIVIDHVKYGGQIFEGGYRVQGEKIVQTVDTPFGRLSGLICWDMDYPTVVQQAGLSGTGLMLVPSSDWLEIDPIHAYMNVYAAIENGMSLVRQTEGGLSIVYDAYGRVLAQTDFFGATDRTMIAQVPVKHVPTLYTAFGRWFEWLCLAGFLIVVARALTLRRLVK